MKNLAVVVVALLSYEGLAGSVQIGEYAWTYSITDGRAAILGVSTETGDMQIPDTIIEDGVGYPVTSIADYAFADCSGLTSVTMPDGIASIGAEAFSGCTGLSRIALPSTVKVIGHEAFHGCVGLTQVTIPGSVVDFGYAAFEYCSGLTDVTIDYGVGRIGDNAFFDCSGLANITIPNSVTNIGSGTFQGCGSLLRVTIPSGVTEIPGFTFSSCGSLTSITIPNGVTNIGEYAFQYCTGLTSMTIPDSVMTIKYDAFFECHGLTNVTIGSGVTRIGKYVFAGCRSLQEVYLLGAPPTTGSGIYYRTPSTLITYVPDGSTGWAFPNIAALPEIWPRDDSSGRAIAYGAPGVVDRVTITWMLDDGTVIDADNVPVGLLPTCGTSPTKIGDDPYVYVFTGWTPSVETATTNATYTALFEKRVDLSMLTADWTACDGDVIFGTTGYNVDIPAGATVTINGVKTSGKSASSASAAFDESCDSVVTAFVKDGESWNLTAYTEIAKGAADDVREDMITVLCGETADGVTNCVVPAQVLMKNAVKAEIVVEPPHDAGKYFYRVRFGSPSQRLP